MFSLPQINHLLVLKTTKTTSTVLQIESFIKAKEHDWLNTERKRHIFYKIINYIYIFNKPNNTFLKKIKKKNKLKCFKNTRTQKLYFGNMTNSEVKHGIPPDKKKINKSLSYFALQTTFTYDINGPRIYRYSYLQGTITCSIQWLHMIDNPIVTKLKR